MKIIFLGDALNPPITGVGRYVIELYGSLSSHISSVSFWFNRAIVQCLPEEIEKSHSSSFGFGFGFGFKRFILEYLDRYPAFKIKILDITHWLDMLSLSRFVRNSVVHGPNFHIPYLKAARVVTIHDLSVFTWAHCHPYDRVLRMRHTINKSIKCAHRIITPSEFSRKEILAYFKLPPERVVSIPLACDARFGVHAINQEVLSGLVSKSYGLFVATIEPRKNICMLLSAWESLPISLRLEFPLVVAGSSGWCSKDIHLRLMHAEKEGWLRYLGFVPDEKLPSLYAHAKLFCFPSWYEGFGLPVLEAMASGVPVVCSSSSCLPEVGGSAVRYASPDDLLAWSAAIYEVLTNSEEENRLSEAGLLQAKKFSWVRTAEMTLSVYQEALLAYSQE